MNDDDKKAWNEYADAINAGLQKHIERNNSFLDKNNFLDTFFWMQDHIKETANKSMTRTPENSDLFNAMLTVEGCYNSVMDFFSKDELDEKVVTNFMRRIQDQEKIIRDLKK